MGRPCTPVHKNPSDHPGCGHCAEVVNGKTDRPSPASSIPAAKIVKPRIVARETKKANGPCIFLGEKVRVNSPREYRSCMKGHGTVCRCKTFDPTAAKAGNLHGCDKCPDYKGGDDSGDPTVRRHLLFHIMPVAGNGIWQHNCDHLIRRISVFNGRRLCGIVTENPGDKFKLDPPGEVQEYLQDYGFDFFETPNSNSLREYVTWDALWGGISDRADSNDLAFRCHAKGVTKPDKPAIRLWTDMLYEWLLDYMPAVENSLKDHPVTSILNSMRRHFTGSRAQWHYSGSFYWVRVRDTFQLRGPSKIERRWYGVESWPGCVWPKEIAGCLHDPFLLCDLSPYSERDMRDVILAFFEKWKEENRDKTTSLVSMTK